MQNLEMKLDGEKLIIRHPEGVVVLLDFTDLRTDLSAGATSICGIRMAAKPSEPPANLRRTSGEPPANLRRTSGEPPAGMNH